MIELDFTANLGQRLRVRMVGDFSARFEQIPHARGRHPPEIRFVCLGRIRWAAGRRVVRSLPAGP